MASRHRAWSCGVSRARRASARLSHRARVAGGNLPQRKKTKKDVALAGQPSLEAFFEVLFCFPFPPACVLCDV
jgi:hypothetical protein